LEPADASLAPPPRANPDLVGHDAAERELRRLFDAGRLPHALLFGGPRGIGKATLAFRLARFVLAGAGGEGLAVAAESGAFRRVASGGHADLLTVERGWDARRRRLRSEIVVDDAREIGAFLHLTPAEGGWRVVVVDGADEMNRNAANALLKILEEPPRQTLLVLVAHSPGRLLPTIRSRCRRMALAPLADETVHALLARYRPDLAAEERAALSGLAEGSIGRALDFAAVGGAELYRTVSGLMARLDLARLHGFADRLVRPDATEAYRAVEELLCGLLARRARAAAAEDGAAAARWARLRVEIGDTFARTEALNLDRKQAILGAFFAIGGAAE
jgi:DNA polymerase-3 subunit delta'